MSLQKAQGSFAQDFLGLSAKTVMRDTTASVGTLQVGPAWSQGCMASTIVTPQPSPTERWTIYGFTLSYNGYMQFPVGVPGFPQTDPIFALRGELWAGLVVGTPLGHPDSPQFATGQDVPTLPGDLSTFVKLWTMDEDAPFPQVPTSGGPIRYVPRGITFMFPQPVEIRFGEEISMSLIKTPMLGANCHIGVERALYSIMYDSAHHLATAE